MAINYVTITERDFGNGVDQESAENQIKPGFVETLKNMDPNSEGFLSKRKGYETVAGNVPFRVKRYEEDVANGQVCFQLDGSVNLSTLRSTPIIVKGRLSENTTGTTGNEFVEGSDTFQYYADIDTDIRFTIGTGFTTETLTASDHEQDDDFLFLLAASSTNAVAFDNSQYLPDSVRFHSGTKDLEIDVNNGTGNTFDGFFVVEGKSNETGVTYITPAPIGSGTTILASTHGLRNNQIGVKTFSLNGSIYTEFIPDRVAINVGGDVTIDFSAVSDPVYAVLTSVEDLNSVTGTAAPQKTTTVTISSEEPFLFVYPYIENVLTSDVEAVIPQSVVHDSAAGTTTVTFVNGQLAAANFFVYYEVAQVQVAEICVTPNGTINGAVDTGPQLTLWGLDHEGIYDSDAESKAGWVQHVDSYRSAGERFLVCGLGGNLFRQLQQAEAPTGELPTYYPRLLNRLSTSLDIGPAFTDLLSGASRTRGLLEFVGGGDGYAKGTSATYNSGTGWVDYTLSVPSVNVNGTLTSILTVDQDYLTVTGASHSRNEGEFLIKAISLVGEVLTVSVANPRVTSSDFNEQDSGMRCGVFTDEVLTLTTAEFLPEDQLSSAVFADADIRIVRATGTTCIARNVNNFYSLPLGQRVTATRTSEIIPLTNGVAPDVENVLRGDSLTVTGYSRKPRVVAVNSRDDETVNIVDGAVTLSSGDTTNLTVGTKILLYQAGDYTGVQTVASITGELTFTLDTAVTGTTSGILAGKTITIDENTLEVQGDTRNAFSLAVGSRWYPIEIPQDNFENTPKGVTTHFDTNDYDSQPVMRSTMVQDSLFITNGDDEVSKFDGTNVYRAGLPRWQPAIFAHLDETTGTGIEIPAIQTATNNTESSPVSTIVVNSVVGFSEGDSVEVQSTPVGHTKVTVISIDVDNSALIIDSALRYQSGDLVIKEAVYRYYFRLNAIDANNNVVASAVTGAEDFYVEVVSGDIINIRLVGFPAWDLYDYDRLELQVYRTKYGATSGPFYRVAIKSLNFDNCNGYIDFQDQNDDDVITELDGSITAISGSELATQLTEPFRAKYISSLENRLILANVKSYPQLRINFEGSALTSSSFVNDTYLFRKDNTDTLTTTDMVNRVAYTFVYSSASVNVTVASGVATLSAPQTSGDWIYLQKASADLTFGPAGWWQLDSTTTFKCPGIPDGTYNNQLISVASGAVPVYIGTDDNNLGTRFGNNSLIIKELAAQRLANAINSTMRQTDRTIAGQGPFKPWLIANAGGEYGSGELIVKQPKVLPTTFEVVAPSALSYDLFVNNVKVSASGQSQAQTFTYPSRVLASYPNFPELFDNPAAGTDAFSDSAVDVNSADGQEITGVIPFFGEAAFGAAQKDSTLVVFKTNSIYLVNFAAKAVGLQAVQRLETQGLGCTAPYSIAVTRQGIMFANESGIYRLTRSLSIDYVGSRVERIWENEVNRDALDLAQGHHYGVGRQYKLSVPLSGATLNSDVLAYNHTRESRTQGQIGGWTRYDNHAATGWANLGNDAFFGSTRGRVFKIRNSGEVQDFRDDDEAINAEVVMRALDFGDGAVRKYLRSIILHLRTPEDATGTTMAVALNLKAVFNQLDGFIVDVEDSTDGLSDTGIQKISSIKFNTQRSKFSYIQTKFTNAVKDENVQITAVEFRVAGLKATGLFDAAVTSSTGGSNTT